MKPPLGGANAGPAGMNGANPMAGRFRSLSGGDVAYPGLSPDVFYALIAGHRMDESPLIGLALIAASVLGLVLSWHLRRKTAAFRREAIRATGTVLELIRVVRTSNSNDGLLHRDTFAPRYAFRAPDGREVVVISPSASYPPAYRVGQQVAVLHNPRTGETRLSSWMELAGGPILLAGFCVLLLALGGLIVSQ